MMTPPRLLAPGFCLPGGVPWECSKRRHSVPLLFKLLHLQGLSLGLGKRQKFCQSHSSDENYPVPGRDCARLFPLPAALRQQSPQLRSSEQRFPYRQERLV
jgi:hypothetical protein